MEQNRQILYNSYEKYYKITGIKGDQHYEAAHFQIEFTNERIVLSGGLTLVGHILENSGFIDRLNKQDVTGRSSGQ